MHIKVEHQKFKEALELVARVSTKHVTLPVLQCVLLDASQNTLTIKATNLEIGIEATIDTTETEPGTVAVPAHTLLATISLITQRTITIKLEGETLKVFGGGSSSKINTVSHEEFPTIPKLTEKPQELNGKTFAAGVKTVAFAASQSSIKPELGSVYIFQKKEHSLTFVATDSFRLMEKTAPQQGILFEDAILIPQRNALELARVCEVVEQNPKLHVAENQCALTFDNIYITSRLTSGNFPDYEQIIPKEYKTHATLLTKDLSQSLKKTNIFLNKYMQLTFTITERDITLSAQSGEVGSTEEALNASVEGEEITLNFNQRYITEAIPYIVDDSVTLHFAGIGRPMVMESVHDRSLRYLVMPMNK